MAITATNIENAVYESGGTNYFRFKRGTFGVLPPSSSDSNPTVIQFQPNTSSNGSHAPLDSIEGSGSSGRYLYISSTKDRIRIESINDTPNASGFYEITLERPLDVSDFRSYTNVDGERFSESIADYTLTETITISIDAEQLREIDNSNSNDTIDRVSNFSGIYNITDTITLPAHCCVNVDRAVLRLQHQYLDHSGQPNTCAWIFGRLHTGDYEDADGNFYTSGGVHFIDVRSSSSAAGSATGGSYRFVNCIYDNITANGLTFLRLNGGSNNERAQMRNELIDTSFVGNVGARVTGDRSFIQNLKFNAASYKGVHVRIDTGNTFGLIDGLEGYDSNAVIYGFLSNLGPTTTFNGVVVANPNQQGESLPSCTVNLNRNTSSGDRVVNVDNIDINAFKAIETQFDSSDYLFIRREDGASTLNPNSYVRVHQDWNIEVFGPDGTVFDEDDGGGDTVMVKSFIHTVGSSDDPDGTRVVLNYEEEEGTGALGNHLVRIRQWQIPHQFRWDSTPDTSDDSSITDIEYVNDLDGDDQRLAYATVRAYGYNQATTTSNLYDPETNNWSPLLTVDENITETDFSVVEAYTELDTTAQLYDYGAYMQYDDMDYYTENGQDQLITLNSDNEIEIAGDQTQIVFNTSLTDPDFTAFDTSDTAIRIKVPSDGEFNGDLNAGSKDVYLAGQIKGTIKTTGSIFVSTWTDLAAGDTLAETDGALEGTLALGSAPAGSYQINGTDSDNTLDISGLTITADNAVTITTANTTGSPDVTNANVTLQSRTDINIALEEDFVSTNATYCASTRASDDTLTVVDTTDSAVFVLDSTTDPQNIKVSITHGASDTVDFHLFYDQYVPRTWEGVSGIVSSTLEKFDTTVLDTSITLPAAVTTALSNTTVSINDDGDFLTIVVPNTENGLTISGDPAGSDARKWFWELMKLNDDTNGDWCEFVRTGQIGINDITFDANGILVTGTAVGQISIDKASPGDGEDNESINIDLQVLDAEGTDYSDGGNAGITASDTDNKVIFDEKKNNVALDNAAIARIQSTINDAVIEGVEEALRPLIKNAALGVPIVNEDGDAFESTPSLPS